MVSSNLPKEWTKPSQPEVLSQFFLFFFWKNSGYQQVLSKLTDLKLGIVYRSNFVFNHLYSSMTSFYQNHPWGSKQIISGIKKSSLEYLHMHKSCQKLQNSDFQGKFSMSNMISSKLSKFLYSLNNIILGAHVCYWHFFNALFSKTMFYFWQLLYMWTQDLKLLSLW